MDIYAENILQHYKYPLHQEPMADPTVTHEEVNHSCGDAITVKLKIENGELKNVSWEGTGCAISQASMSMLSEELMGKETTHAEQLTVPFIKELLGVPVGERRFKCALLSLHTVKNALHKFKNEPLQGWVETTGM